MKSCYVLIVETDVRKPAGRGDAVQNAERTTRVFADFETAKKAMRTTLKSFAQTDNGLFDGNGNNAALEREWDDCSFHYDGEDDMKVFEATPDLLRAYFLGEEVTFDETFLEKFSPYEFEMSENFSGWFRKSKNDNVRNIQTDQELIPFRMYGLDQFSLIQINAFVMDDPDQVYVCRIRNGCDEYSQPEYLYLELRKVDVE